MDVNMIKRLLKGTIYNETFRNRLLGTAYIAFLAAVFIVVIVNEGWLGLLFVILMVIGLIVALPLFVAGGLMLLERLRDWTYKE